MPIPRSALVRRRRAAFRPATDALVSSEDADAKRELRHSFTLRVGAAAAGMVSTFLLTVIVVRTLNPLDTAAFFAVLAALSIGSVVGRLGLGPNVIRLIPS